MRARSTMIVILAAAVGVLAIGLANIWLANQHSTMARSETAAGEPYPESLPSKGDTPPQPGGGSPATGFDPEPGTEPSGSAVQIGGDDRPGSGGGGFGGGDPYLPPPTPTEVTPGAEPAPEPVAPGSSDVGATLPTDGLAPGGDDVDYLEAARLRAAELERLRYEEAVRAAQRRYEEELARRQEGAQAGAEQTHTEDQDGAQPVPPPLPLPGEGTAGAEPPAETETVVRHPTLDAPDQVISGQEFTVSVALTEDQVTPDVTVRAGPESSVTPEGALEFSLPASVEEWPIDIDLLAAGFDLTDAGAWTRRVTLYKVGDSDFVRFTLKPRAVREDSKPRQLIARLYHEGRFLGSVSRPVIVFRDQVAMDNGAALGDAAAGAASAAGLLMVAGTQPEPALASDIRIDGAVENVPDLDVTIHYSDPDKLGDGLIIIHSPHIGAPVSAEFATPEGMNLWLDSEYMRLVTLGLQVRGARPLQGQAPAASREFITKVAEGFGSDLYRNYVPGAFKDVFWSLKAKNMLHSIQITSNSPVLPWELVRPEAPDGTPDGFLGMNYRLARWAPRSTGGQVDRPLDRLPFTGVATVAPAYDNNLALPFQKVEVEALSKLAGFRLVDGDFSSFERLVGEVSTGFIHFSGHGEVNDPGTGSPVFAIRLLDQVLDPTTWRALTFAPHDNGNPFFFFNACDTGRARSLGGFVQGWGPAVLASGASGFIGGMWPLTDQTAASFSTDFYGGIADHLKEGPVYLAEVLQGVRKQFYETGDPTYLAYTFYGNANLQIVSR